MATLDREHEPGGSEVRLEQDGQRVVVRARGELDQASASAFEVELRRAIRASPVGVIVDLGGVTFIDSICLRILISAAMLSDASRREFIVLHASEQVQHAIETSGVEDLLPLAD
jgi:anti-sigma B factor antagonist